MRRRAGHPVGAVPAAEEDDAAEVRAARRARRGCAARGVGVEADHEQLARALAGVRDSTVDDDAGGRGVLAGRGDAVPVVALGVGVASVRCSRRRRGGGGRRVELTHAGGGAGGVARAPGERQGQHERGGGDDGRAAGRAGSRRRGQHPSTVREPACEAPMPRTVAERGRRDANLAHRTASDTIVAMSTDAVPSLPVVLDVDTGVDDACALLLAALHPRLDLRAVTCVGGNAPLDDVVRNTLIVLETAGRADVPVGMGRRAAPARGAGRRAARARRRRHGRPRDAGARPSRPTRATRVELLRDTSPQRPPLATPRDPRAARAR